MNQSLTVTATVTILDKEYCIACPPEERENLEDAARYLDNRMRQIRSHGKVIGTERVAVMAALNITHQLLHGSESTNPNTETTHQQVRKLLERVDLALTSDQNCADN